MTLSLRMARRSVTLTALLAAASHSLAASPTEAIDQDGWNGPGGTYDIFPIKVPQSKKRITGKVPKPKPYYRAKQRW